MTQFQALDIVNVVQKSGISIASLKYVQQVVKSDQAEGWEQIVELPENKNRVGLGFSPYTTRRTLNHEVIIRPIQEVFLSAGFINPGDQAITTISEEDSDPEWPCFVTYA